LSNSDAHAASGWFAAVPDRWTVGNIRRFAQMRTGHTPSRSEPAYWVDCTIPWFTLADVWQIRDGKQKILDETSEKISELGLANSANELLPARTVILSRTASVGFAGIMPTPMATSQDFWNWVCGPALSPDFLYWQLCAMGRKFRETANGSTHKTIYQGDAASLVVCFPPLETQQRIAAFLDEKTAQIDALIEKKRALLDRLAEKRQAIITQAVTKGLNPAAPMKDSGIDWLGQIPAHWDVAAVGHRYQVQLGRMLNAERVEGNDLKPYLRVYDVQWGSINVDDLPLMDFPTGAQRRYRLSPGDLLVNEGGSYVGRSAIWEGQLEECYYQKALHRLRPYDEKSDITTFLLLLMDMAVTRGVFVAGGNQTTIDHLTAEQLRRYRFGFPPFDEQTEIVVICKKQIDYISVISDKITGSLGYLSEYRSALITAAVTGQIKGLR
jgi:type I restriction enzyme S subunit